MTDDVPVPADRSHPYLQDLYDGLGVVPKPDLSDHEKAVAYIRALRQMFREGLIDLDTWETRLRQAGYALARDSETAARDDRLRALLTQRTEEDQTNTT